MPDNPPPIALGQALVMTPMLQLAIKLLSTPSAKLPALVEAFCAQHPGALEPLLPHEPDPPPEQPNGPDDNAPWEYLESDPLASVGADVWVFGNPPQVRANRHVVPRLKPLGTSPDARFLLRALRQRMKTYETVVRAVVAVHPQLTVSLEPHALKPIAVRALADSTQLHESTVTRVASACLFQNLHGVLAFELHGKRLGFRRA